MAGHSQWKNIMHRKGAQDAKRAKTFTKLLREITIAAKTGNSDPIMNPRLRTALTHARHANVPKDTIERAILRATQGHEQYEEICYEGFGPGQSAFLVEVMTDNRNRSASEIRTLFQKNGGHFGNTSFLFSHVGVIIYKADQGEKTRLFEMAIESEVLDVQEEEDKVTIICPRDKFFELRDHLESLFGEPEQAYCAWLPQVNHEIEDPSHLQAFEKLVSLLEEHEDVHAVWTNVG